VASTFDRCVVASAVDADYLRRAERLRNVALVPNPVDTEYFTPRRVTEQPATFVLSGLMDKLVNIDAAGYLCHQIWPRVLAEVPNARLRLVGPHPNRAVRRLAAHPGVEVVGYVADLRDEIASATAVVVPLRIGVGTKNKVLQSLSMGRAVVTTRVGNEGLDAQNHTHLEVADDAQRFAAAMVELQADPRRRAALGGAGRAWVSQHYSVPVVMERLEQVLAEAVG
jgi:glycosyltransferase involved in cell wall biosynthesis